MSNIKISKKINNTEYAPGIATYGSTGENGQRGDNGNCIYYTSFNIISGEDLPSIKRAVREQLLPVRDGGQITREYQNGDYFFDKFGNVLQLYNIEDLKNHPNLGNNYLRFFHKVGKIKSSDAVNNIFSTIENSSRISLNAGFAGLDINSAESSINDPSTENYPLRIISNNLDGDNIELLHATAFHNYDKMPDFKIYYDTVLNVWHINSDIPVVIDSELAVNTEDNDSVDIDGYSPILINDTPITVFYNYCRNIRWAVNGSTGIQLFNFPKFPDNIKKNIKVKFFLQNEQSEQTIFVNAVDTRWDDTMKFTGTFASSDVKQISLIYNIEVFIDKVYVPEQYMQNSYNIHKDKSLMDYLTIQNTWVQAGNVQGVNQKYDVIQ